MAVQLYSVYKDSSNQYYKVLKVESNQHCVSAVIIKDDDVKGMPKSFLCSFIETLEKLEIDPFKLSFEESQLSKFQIKTRDNRYRSIEFLVDDINIFDPRWRNIQLKAIARKKKISRTRLYQRLKLYWMRGPEINSLVPPTDKCGGKGKEKKYKSIISYSKRKRGSKPIVFITDVEKKVIQKGFKKFYRSNEQASLENAYKLFLAEENYSSDDVKPTLRQFHYWGLKNVASKQIAIERIGEIVFNKDIRFKPGSTWQNSFGPGSISMIDSTKDNIHVLNRTRKFYIGRFTVYVAVDVFSTAYIGLYVTSENPSYLAACGCLVNIAEDKKEFCERYGVEYRPEDWIFDHVPLKLIADRGELISGLSDSLVKNLGIDNTNTPSYRPDLKGPVEYAFNRFQSRVRSLLKKRGLVDGSKHPRIASESFKDACLTKSDVYKLLIEIMIDLNRNRWVASHPFEAELAADDISCTPINLWKFGVSNGMGCIRKRTKEDIWMNCLPSYNMPLEQRGIRFFRKLWVPIHESDVKLLESLYFQNVTTVRLSINKHYLDHAFWVHEERFIPIKMKIDNRIEDFFEFEASNERVTSLRQVHKEKALDEEVQTLRKNKRTIDEAYKMKEKNIDFKSARAAKAEEVIEHRKETYERYIKPEETVVNDKSIKAKLNKNESYPSFFND